MGTITQNGQVTHPGTKVRHYAENGAITQNNTSQVTQKRGYYHAKTEYKRPRKNPPGAN